MPQLILEPLKATSVPKIRPCWVCTVTPTTVLDKAQAALGYGGHSARLPFQVVGTPVRGGVATTPTRSSHQGQSLRSARGLAPYCRGAGQTPSVQGDALSRPLGKVGDAARPTSIGLEVLKISVMKTLKAFRIRVFSPLTTDMYGKMVYSHSLWSPVWSRIAIENFTHPDAKLS